MSEAILELKHLEKCFGDSFRLGPINAALAPGETLGLVGKNGAGKTTLLNLLTGSSDATEGTINLLGKRLTPDKFELKRSIGYLPQELFLPRWVTPREILGYACGLYELKSASEKISAAMEYWDCSFYSGRPIAACSHGMQKRVALALVTLHNPGFLVLDEPFSGLDVYHIRALENEIKRRSEAGNTTIVSTHVVPFAAKLCDRIMIMKDGKLDELQGIAEREYLQRIAEIEGRFF